MQCFQITALNANVLFQILELIDKVKDKSFTLKQYAQYLTFNINFVGLFGVFRENELVAYLHAEAPHPLDSDIGFISIAASKSIASKKVNEDILRLAEQWLKSHGAKLWRMTTKRRPAVWKRRYGLECVGNVDGEFIMQKKINNVR